MVRKKDLIETFCVDEIKSAVHHIEASTEHLKVWKDRKTGDYTFSFYRNGPVKQQLECALSSFELKRAKNRARWFDLILLKKHLCFSELFRMIQMPPHVRTALRSHTRCSYPNTYTHTDTA